MISRNLVAVEELTKEQAERELARLALEIRHHDT